MCEVMTSLLHQPVQLPEVIAIAIVNNIIFIQLTGNRT